MKENYINIPFSVMKRTDLSQTEKIIYGFVNGFGNRICYASNGYIAEVIGLKPLAVSRAIKKLISKDMLESKNDGGRNRTLSLKIDKLIFEDSNLISEDRLSLSPEIDNNIAITNKNTIVDNIGYYTYNKYGMKVKANKKEEEVDRPLDF